MRAVNWEADGIMLKPDPRPAEVVTDQLEVRDARPVKIPGMKEEGRRSEEEKVTLEK